MLSSIAVMRLPRRFIVFKFLPSASIKVIVPNASPVGITTPIDVPIIALFSPVRGIKDKSFSDRSLKI